MKMQKAALYWGRLFSLGEDMKSKVQIANIALSTYIGSARINSLEEGSKGALQAELHYDSVRRELLEAWPWSFARRRMALAKHAINDRPEWASKFAIPSKCLLLRWVNDPQEAKDAIQAGEIYDTPREIDGQAIYSDLDQASCEYIYDEEDVSRFSEKFVAAFAAALAARMAISITETASKAQYAAGAFEQLIDEAKVADLRNGGFIRVLHGSNWIGAR